MVLAYSGGLDTSIILKWLQDTYGCEVVTFTADLGQGEELEPARAKAEQMGVKEIYIDDLREEFVRDYVFPMFRANAIYEGTYLLGTSIARPLIAKRQIEIAREVGADAVCHGATGKGNDQVRFELGYYGLKPDVKVIAPWREWDLNSRTKLIAYAEEAGIPVAQSKKQDAPYSMDANLLHISYEGNALEDPWEEYSEDMFTRSVSPEDAPDEPTYIEIEFKNGDPVAIDGVEMSPATMLTALNKYGGDNGIGRLDIVESRFVGMKSRGVYETPGGTILINARRAPWRASASTAARCTRRTRLMPRYAELIYNGFGSRPSARCSSRDRQVLRQRQRRGACQAVQGQRHRGRDARRRNSLYNATLSTFEDDGGGAYDQKDAAGFIKIQALRSAHARLAEGAAGHVR